MRTLIIFALFCLTVASGTVIALGGVPLGVSIPIATPTGIVVGNLGVPGLIGSGIIGSVRVIG